MYILTHEFLNTIEKNKELKIIEKEQTGNFVGMNYFITPKISIKLYKPKVLFVNSKNITFEMSKINTGLIGLLKRCDNVIMEDLNKLIDIEENTVKYNIFYENDNSNNIYLRAYLPCYKSKYLIKYLEEGKETHFKLPRVNSILDEVVLDIRNLWFNNNKIGYNLELKYINIY